MYISVCVYVCVFECVCGCMYVCKCACMFPRLEKMNGLPKTQIFGKKCFFNIVA